MFPAKESPLPGQEELSLYLHIPFCTVKCGYCDFFSVAGGSSKQMATTVEEILGDLSRLLPLVAPPPDDDTAELKTLYIGGGTPTLLPPSTLESLLGGIRRHLRVEPVEWTIEANPESLTTETLELLEEYGVNRISLGVQSFRESALRALGRAAGAERTVRSVELLNQRWKGRWNADLIVGYEGDTPRRVAEDIETLCSLGASHLSVYALTVEEGTPLFRAVRDGRATLPGDERVLELLSVAESALEERGIRRYEVSNYAADGEESVHNLAYWRLKPYLGLGPAAASTLFLPQAGAIRMEAVPDLPTYLRYPADRYRREELTRPELLEEQLIMGLRTSEGIPLSRLESLHGLNGDAIRRAIGKVGTLLEIDELPEPTLRIPKERWAILDKGVLLAAEALLPLLAEPC